MKKGILFDLDGTLWDSSATVIEAWNRCLAEQTDIDRTYTQEQMRSYMGKTLDKIADLMFPDKPVEERLRLMKLCSDYENKYLETHSSFIFPNEREIMQELHKNYFLAIISNCQAGYIELFLQQCGFGELFDDHECSRTGLSKGENIKLVAQRNNIEKYLYVGDTQLDLEAAQTAGIPFIHAGYGFGKPERFDAQIMDIGELPKAASMIL